jgi:hypothetical protein
VLCLGATARGEPACNRLVKLSQPVGEFEIRKVSRIHALLQFGKENGICFGIEYVDRGFLTELTDVELSNTTVGRAIESILGAMPALSIITRGGIVEIGRKAVSPGGGSVFDFVMPKWEAQRGPIQWVSLNLHMGLEVALDPKIKGFGGDIPGGDAKDEVGPFREYNKTIRYLLDEIVAQSKGGAWITQVPWGARRNYYLVGGHQRWTIVEYSDPNADFAALVRNMAENLP